MEEPAIMTKNPAARRYWRKVLERMEGLVLYHWNRRYPADAWLDVRPGPPGWTLARREEFSGHSHERITKEVYTR